MNSRTEGIRLLREAARQQAAGGSNVRQAHKELAQACRALLEDFRLEFDVPGVRYWEIYFDPESPEHHRVHMTTFVVAIDELHPLQKGDFVELTRDLYFCRQGMHNGYEDVL